MNSTFVVYVDEAGDEGFLFEKGSSHWFVLSGVIIRKAIDVQVVKLVDSVRARIGRPEKKPLHFSHLKHEKRIPYIDAIASAALRAVSILIHKPSLKEPEAFQERHRLYSYAVRYLLERVSWYCRDHRTAHDAGDGSAEVVFSNRAAVSYEEIGKYLMRLERLTGARDIRIDWSVIKRTQIKTYSSGKRMGLQIADAVASGFYYAVQPSPLGFTEDRYARMLKPVVYQRRGRYLGYGVKFWPREVTDTVLKQDALAWVAGEYK